MYFCLGLLGGRVRRVSCDSQLDWERKAVFGLSLSIIRVDRVIGLLVTEEWILFCA